MKIKDVGGNFGHLLTTKDCEQRFGSVVFSNLPLGRRGVTYPSRGPIQVQLPRWIDVWSFEDDLAAGVIMSLKWLN